MKKIAKHSVFLKNVYLVMYMLYAIYQHGYTDTENPTRLHRHGKSNAVKTYLGASTAPTRCANPSQ